MATAYATSTDLTAYTGAPAPADADRQLQRASDLVDSVVCATFSVDGAGLPTLPAILAALRDATCAQVEQWSEVGEVNAVDGLAGTSMNIGGYQGVRAPEVAPRTLEILAGAGLLSPAGSTLSVVNDAYFFGTEQG